MKKIQSIFLLNLCFLFFFCKSAFSNNFVQIPEYLLSSFKNFSNYFIEIPNWAVDGGYLDYRLISMHIPEDSVKEIYFREKFPFSENIAIIAPNYPFYKNMTKEEFQKYKEVNIEYFRFVFQHEAKKFIAALFSSSSNSFNYVQDFKIKEDDNFRNNVPCYSILKAGVFLANEEFSFSYFKLVDGVYFGQHRRVLNIIEEFNQENSLKMLIYKSKINDIMEIPNKISKFYELKMRAQQVRRGGK